MFFPNQKIQVIPATDILNSQLVRLKQGDFSQSTNYAKDPILQAKEFAELGFKKLHLVNLDGARDGKITNLDLFQKMVSQSGLKVDYGGGIKNLNQVEKLFEIGIEKVNLGSLLVSDPLESKKILKKYPKRVILGLDVKAKKEKPKSLDDFEIYISGWKVNTKKTLKEILDEYLEFDFKFLTCTDIAKDGMLNGPNFELYKMILTNYPNLKVIASGGLSSKEDIFKLDKIGCWGVILGKAYYEGKVIVNK
jgi:phosphoribosylformimino-5-aminoimidazole carboxamide ribotide isomerase